ncbi:hypothetical protein GQR58_014289 [Nymphon striatum]|nr:hypothetical protein GQR58_014289 [Nymphon striatum]
MAAKFQFCHNFTTGEAKITNKVSKHMFQLKHNRQLIQIQRLPMKHRLLCGALEKLDKEHLKNLYRALLNQDKNATDVAEEECVKLPYAKSARLYLQQMETLEQTMPRDVILDTCHYSYRVKMTSSNARYDNVDNVSDTLSSSSEISEDEIDLSSCEDNCEEIGGWGKCVEPYKFQPLKSVSEDRYTSVSNSPF